MSVAQKSVVLHSELLDRIAEARARTDELFQIVRPDSLYERPIAERHRIIFYVGHLEAFDWNLLRERALGKESFDPQLDHLFAFGIDPVDGGLPTDQPSDWPGIEQVRAYVSRVRNEIDAELEPAIASEVSTSAPQNSGLNQLLNVAIEHRLMHAETLAYMLHQLPVDRKIRPADSPQPTAAPLSPSMVEIPAGRATLGLPRDNSARDGSARNGSAFGWDNEFEEYTVEVPAFNIDRYKVTNGEYRNFVAAGGYDNRTLWSEADWHWRTAARISRPIFWNRAARDWTSRTMFGEIPLPLDWPVYVSHAEASAYARWAGKALPTEAQWHRAAYGTLTDEQRAYPWGNQFPDSTLGNFDFRRWDPCPVNSHPQGDSAFGVSDLVGNGWEWTSTQFGPFPGFEAFPFYPGYSANFFDGKHFVMKGGSPRTAACMLRRSFRNWFQPHYQYVYAAFRCVSH